MIDYKGKIPQDWYNEIIKEINWDIYTRSILQMKMLIIQ